MILDFLKHWFPPLTHKIKIDCFNFLRRQCVYFVSTGDVLLGHHFLETGLPCYKDTLGSTIINSSQFRALSKASTLEKLYYLIIDVFELSLDIENGK